ncbi:MAG TPA: hypothetical protein VGH11_16525 [Jatrophihabitans sp.]
MEPGNDTAAGGTVALLLRRWYLTLIGLALTVGFAATAIFMVAPTYQAKASLLLLPPKSPATGSNPYLALGGLQGATDVLARAMSDSSTLNQLAQSGATGTFAVLRDPNTSGPVLLVTATASDSASAVRDVDLFIHLVPSKLASLQESIGVPSSAALSSSAITQDRTAAINRKSQIRAILVAVAAGVVITVAGISLLENFVSRPKHSDVRAVSVSASHEAPDRTHLGAPRMASTVARSRRRRSG